MTRLRLQGISKRFGQTVAVHPMDLAIEPGELFFLLGPSGCGKSTLLRLIAGLHEPNTGRLFFNDADVTALPTQQRNAVMCFQSYALWPHMSVQQNIAFGLGVRGVKGEPQRQRVDEVLKLVQMTELAQRKPNELSGGQQQRVALARALAVRPACLLLDEPLSNLDAKLRQEMRAEIRRICKSAGFTTVYVTHDQKEALSMADRIAVLKDGRLVQVGTPDELYHRPATVFVADFIGQTNLLAGKVIEQSNGVARVQTPAGVISAKCAGALPAQVTLSIRPEQLRPVAGSVRSPAFRLSGEEQAKACTTNQTANRLTGKAIENTFLGEMSEHVLEVNGARLKMIAAPPLLRPETVTVEFAAEDVVVLKE